ncbi:bifunctional DNA-formamidopyrimidine glycosylase/DNA-(apurinic or apyrimidinic site) lyase [Granulosicoccaceae sp. 1_MG-2023]|nr:bifunctional DNA-formamidopyrimidine glycosylase/DNA-(apurinic or apyrimidinic site) lyase [Granulosicoccaceae sp. 1_MG-2023]
MPELPEVETTRRGIEPWLSDRIISDVLVHNAALRWPVPDSVSGLAGLPLLSIARRGKYLLLSNARGSAIVHLGMSGSLRICQDNSPRRKHDHVEFVLENGHRLRFHDPRRFGCLLWTAEDPHRHPLIAALGPEPLSEAFNADYLFAATRKRRIAIKNLIMDSHVVVGVGNIYASESLFMAGIRPGRAAQGLSRAEAARLTQCIHEVLGKAIEQGGTTLRDFVNSDGNPGYFAQSLQVYGRQNEPCRRCQSPVKMKVIGQRASFYCPACQK